MFLTPEGVPFFAGTYFPKESRHGLPAFSKVLEAVAQAWSDRREDVSEQGRRVLESIGRGAAVARSAEPLTDEVLREAHAGLRASYDPRWGGFGRAPKFPQPMTLEFLLRCHLRGYPGALDMVRTTLDRMAAGGIHDHVGGGFHRYSVDERWLVPHFEKMLYDNAQLARLYAHAWQLTGDHRYRRVAERTLDYLLREMRHPEGGFFSSQDADSEGEEGRFFAWSWDELIAAVGESTARSLGATPRGNWEDGRNVLHSPDGQELSDEASGRLLQLRDARIHPATDDKVLAAWNGLAITAFAEAGRMFGESTYVDAAVGAGDFVLSRLRREDGRLLRSWREGHAAVPGYLDDHALLAEACLTLYETTFDSRFFDEARRLADEMLRLFRDPEDGGFFQTGTDGEELVVRPRELFDNAVPSGNSAAALVLQRLALLTGEDEYELAGVSALRVVRGLMARAPAMLGQALSALDLYVGSAREVAIVGDPGGEDTARLVREVHGRFLPNAVLAVGSDGEVPLLKDRPRVDGKATAYVCERFVCKRPVTNPEELAEQLAS